MYVYMVFHAAYAARESCSASRNLAESLIGGASNFHIPQRLSRYLSRVRNARPVIRRDYMPPTPGSGQLMQLEARPLADHLHGVGHGMLCAA